MVLEKGLFKISPYPIHQVHTLLNPIKKFMEECPMKQWDKTLYVTHSLYLIGIIKQIS